METPPQWMPHEPRVICDLFCGEHKRVRVEAEWQQAYCDGSLDVRIQSDIVRVQVGDWVYRTDYLRSYLNPMTVHSSGGLNVRLCKERLKGRGIQVAADFTVTQKAQIIIWGSALLEAASAHGEASEELYHYQWGGLNGATFTRSSGKVDPSRPMMLVNTTNEGEVANCKFSSSGGFPCIRSLLKPNSVHTAGSFLNVLYYATSGPMSTKSMRAALSKDQAALEAHTRLTLAVRNRPQTQSASVCKNCFLVLFPRNNKAKAHRLTCKKTVKTWTLRQLIEFDELKWVTAESTNKIKLH